MNAAPSALDDGPSVQPLLRRVTLADALSLSYVSIGDEEAAPLLLLHGYTDSWFSFSRILPWLAARHRVIIPDLRGHGASDKLGRRHGRSDFCADAIALLDALGIRQPVVVVGHSLGSLTAQRLAADHPGWVAGLVLIGSAASAAQNLALQELRTQIAAMDTAPGRDFIREFQSATAASPLPETFLESVIDASAKVPLRVWRQALDDLLDARQDVAHGAIQIPTLLIWGEQDAVFSAQDQTALLASIPTAQLARYPDCGHAPHWEQPQRLALELLDFVHSLTPARASAAA